MENAVRAVAVILIAIASLVVAPAALAAPFLFEGSGAGTVDFGPINRDAILALCILGTFICSVLLLPDFDGRRDEDWGFGAEDNSRPY